jgi:hypothetical protein
MANKEHLRRLLDESVEAWNAWGESKPDVRPDLRGIEIGISLHEADLGADLHDATELLCGR